MHVRDRVPNLLNNHGAVLLWLVGNPKSTMREISQGLDITERQVARIIRDLQESHILEMQKEGRCNSYAVNVEASTWHPLLEQIPVQRLLQDLRLMSVPALTIGTSVAIRVTSAL